MTNWAGLVGYVIGVILGGWFGWWLRGHVEIKIERDGADEL